MHSRSFYDKPQLCVIGTYGTSVKYSHRQKIADDNSLKNNLTHHSCESSELIQSFSAVRSSPQLVSQFRRVIGRVVPKQPTTSNAAVIPQEREKYVFSLAESSRALVVFKVQSNVYCNAVVRDRRSLSHTVDSVENHPHHWGCETALRADVRNYSVNGTANCNDCNLVVNNDGIAINWHLGSNKRTRERSGAIVTPESSRRTVERDRGMQRTFPTRRVKKKNFLNFA